MIDMKNVTKRFGGITAVDHVSVAIKEGNVFGLIGTCLSLGMVDANDPERLIV